MHKARLRLILIAAGVLVVVLFFSVSRNRQPEYHGKRLSEWVDLFNQPLSRGRYDPPNMILVLRNEDAADAVRHIGTNALPYLVKWMTYEPPPRWKWKYIDILAKLFRNDTEGKRALHAAEACEELGSDALPFLRQALTNATPASRGVLMSTVRRIEAIPPMHPAAPETQATH